MFDELDDEDIDLLPEDTMDEKEEKRSLKPDMDEVCHYQFNLPHVDLFVFY